MCFQYVNRSLRSSPGWILQCLEPQFALRVERNHHFVFTQDLQSERGTPHTNLVASWRPGKGDGVLRPSLHPQPAGWWGKRSTTVQVLQQSHKSSRLKTIWSTSEKVKNFSVSGLRKVEGIFEVHRLTTYRNGEMMLMQLLLFTLRFPSYHIWDSVARFNGLEFIY